MGVAENTTYISCSSAHLVFFFLAQRAALGARLRVHLVFLVRGVLLRGRLLQPKGCMPLKHRRNICSRRLQHLPLFFNENCICVSWQPVDRHAMRGVIAQCYPREVNFARTGSTVCLQKEQLSEQPAALWRAEHFKGSGEEQGSLSSIVVRTCSA